MKIMFVGDLNLGEYYTAFGHGPKSYNLNTGNSVFTLVKDIFKQADMIVGNLEAAITTNGDNPRDPERNVLKVHPDCAYQLADARFGLVQIANNHIIQHGLTGFNETLKVLDDLGIAYAGKNNTGPTIIDANGRKLAFFAASDVPDNTDKQQSLYQRLDLDFIHKVESCVNDYDHVIVMLHWGLEESTAPLPYQRKLAARLKASGVSAIIGSHPHLFYEIEANRNFICAYSLGNFVFDLCWDSRLTKSGILEIDFCGNELKAAFWPVSIKSSGALPTPSGEPIPLAATYIPYELGKRMRWQQLKKTVHFWLNILHGNTTLKLRFFGDKIRRALGG